MGAWHETGDPTRVQARFQVKRIFQRGVAARTARRAQSRSRPGGGEGEQQRKAVWNGIQPEPRGFQQSPRPSAPPSPGRSSALTTTKKKSNFWASSLRSREAVADQPVALRDLRHGGYRHGLIHETETD